MLLYERENDSETAAHSCTSLCIHHHVAQNFTRETCFMQHSLLCADTNWQFSLTQLLVLQCLKLNRGQLEAEFPATRSRESPSIPGLSSHLLELGLKSKLRDAAGESFADRTWIINYPGQFRNLTLPAQSQGHFQNIAYSRGQVICQAGH